MSEGKFKIDFSKINFNFSDRKTPEKNLPANEADPSKAIRYSDTNKEQPIYFNAEEYLSEEGREYLEKIGGQMVSDLPKITSLMSEAISRQWISKKEKADIISELKLAKTALDTYKILQKITAIAKDPVLKKPEPVEINMEKGEIDKYLTFLGEKLECRLNLLADGSTFVTSDNGASIIFFDIQDKKISAAFTQQELTRILLSTESTDIYNFFSKLLNLLPATSEDNKAAHQVKQEREGDRQIIQELTHLPTGINNQLIKIEDSAKFEEVIQGGGNGKFVTGLDTDFIGTFGMGPCVALIVWQDFGDTQKAIVIHIDSFSGKGSVGLGTAPFLDKYLSTEFINDPSLEISLIGANEGGRQNVLEIYKYLKSKNLSIKSANVLSDPAYSRNIILDVKNGTIYPGLLG